MNQEKIDSLARSRGIVTEYVDTWGKDTLVHPDSEKNVLVAMGYPVDDEEKLDVILQKEQNRHWRSPLNPVYVFRAGEPVIISVRLPVSKQKSRMVWKIIFEGQSAAEISQAYDAKSGKLQNTHSIRTRIYQECLHTLDVPDAPLGYHKIQLCGGRGKVLAEAKLVIAPESCYIPDSMVNGDKLWGFSVQLYCLRSQVNWGIGDFSDLVKLIERSAKLGASFIGLNPLHALYPANPEQCSPYSPSSRRWLNTLYIDVTAVDGYDSLPEVQEYVSSAEFQMKLSEVRAVEYIDYTRVAQLKLPVLKRLYSHFVSQHIQKKTKTAKSFDKFVRDGAESLQQLATYDALQSQFKSKSKGKTGWGWPVWPARFKHYHKADIIEFRKQNEQEIEFYCYLQWIAQDQLETANRAAQTSGMQIGLYRDLAVGVNLGSADVWADQDLYCTDASIGAPPDVFSPLGQNWGLPPMDPNILRQRAYQPVIDLFRSNMQSCGALRIDHVMALMRLWWTENNGGAADKGAYVDYPLDDLLSVLALESHRNQCLVIGEDLGTVPDSFRSKLRANGIHTYRVFFFEQAPDGGFYSPDHYPVQSLSTLTTHDMPTLNGYWHCKDLELGKSLGLYPDEQLLRRLYDERLVAKQQMLNSLHGHFSIPSGIGRDAMTQPMSRELNFGMQVHMAKGVSSLLSLQLEDWLEMQNPVNVPGTYKEYPNWRRKLSANLEDIFANPDLVSLAGQLTKARQNAGHRFRQNRKAKNELN
ncbi:MAG: 4-alpha-glucanotransferase [Gammaproteobacteria bacterium]|nr:MAG: 4-alpha-glucanotransferase [Gammaproteobacteria bacterium]